MTATATTTWVDANQEGLAAALAEVRTALERHAGVPGTDAAAASPRDAAPATVLDGLCATFGLSPFERQVLLLAAGVELDSSVAAACAAAHGDPARTAPTFGQALAALPGAHWSALTPDRPLRRWRLVELEGGSPTTSPLRIDERVLHHLAGVDHLDGRLAGLVEPVPPDLAPVPSQRDLADRLTRAFGVTGQPPLVQLGGPDPDGKHAAAASACATLGLRLLAVAAPRLPTDPRELAALVRLCEREAILSGSALLLACDDLDGHADAARDAAVTQVVESTAVPLLLSTREPRHLPGRSCVTLHAGTPTAAEQRALWQQALGASQHLAGGDHADGLDRLVAQFDLSPRLIRDACAQAATSGDDRRHAMSDTTWDPLWDACRAQARPALGTLADLIQPTATWDDLVVPAAQRDLLAQLASHVRHRRTVYETWRMGRAGGSRGLGTSALFAGGSGTGKTLAAEVVAGELRLDLCRIDLSQVVSKYIGETEKNLRRVFDAAEAGGAVLLFDEADALFGKRTEVRDSHDRYANIEVSYLLQRMESYRGLAILTTNLRDSLDPAFLRRIRFIVGFPFPDESLRAEIWHRAFPPEVPTKDLDPGRLARLNVAGGNIRNIAVNAAFLAAAEGSPVTMRHLERAARAEYAKLDKPLTPAEIGGWS